MTVGGFDDADGRYLDLTVRVSARDDVRLVAEGVAKAARLLDADGFDAPVDDDLPLERLRSQAQALNRVGGGFLVGVACVVADCDTHAAPPFQSSKW